VTNRIVTAGLVACQPRAWRTTTVRGDASAAPVDHVRRDFTADRPASWSAPSCAPRDELARRGEQASPGVKLVGDITYLPTWAGFAYLATVIDCHSQAVIGWSIADHMRTEPVTDALDMAARNVALQPGCVFHSDRGSQ
jgi:putative transposase